VDACDLSKEYAAGVKAIQEVDLYAEAGEIVGLLGPNGAGKSTTLNILATLIRPTGGSAEICGVPIDDVRRVRQQIGVALQDAGLDPVMTAEDHFDIQGALYGIPRKEVEERCAALLSQFGLDSVAGTPVGRYSGGMQRRLALALALIADPPVIILDEPTAGLDPSNRRVVWRQLKDLREQERAVIFSTHYLDEAQELCDRIYLIFDGRIVQFGEPGVIRAGDAAAARRVSFTVCARSDAISQILVEMGIADITEIEETGADMVVGEVMTSADGVELVEELLERMREAHVDVREVHVGTPSLEDVFLALDKSYSIVEPLNGAGLETAARRVRGGRRWG
jgi:ABC-2 type transport system ATP-binding protein